MEKVQAWLQDNLGVILGVCVGVAVIEVWVPSPEPSPCSVLGCPCSADVLGEAKAHQLLGARRQAWPEHCSSRALRRLSHRLVVRLWPRRLFTLRADLAAGHALGPGDWATLPPLTLAPPSTAPGDAPVHLLVPARPLRGLQQGPQVLRQLPFPPPYLSPTSGLLGVSLAASFRPPPTSLPRLLVCPVLLEVRGCPGPGPLSLPFCLRP